MINATATLFDRATMGFSLSVHIVLAVIGIVLPVIILLAEYLGIRYRDNHYIVLARRLSIAFVVMFAVGTASGMLVATELLFLWPQFMALMSAVAIAPLYLEVFAFFMESIFVALYIYSAHAFRERYIHVAIMVVVALGAVLSGVLITMLNSYMNTPVGFNIPVYLQTGNLTDINPIAVFTAPAASIEVPHVVATSYFAGACIFLAYFSFMLLRTKDDRVKQYYKKAIKLAFAIAAIGLVFSLITGVLSIESLFHLQPEKYAAIELNLQPQTNAPEVLGGIYANNSIEYGIAIPGLQSVLANGSASTNVPGLSQYPQSTWPPLFVHDMFDLMVGLGFLIGIFFAFVLLMALMKRNVLDSRKMLWLFIVVGVFATLLLENGWMVDEFGRQPWIIYNVMLVSQAANQSSSIIPIAVLLILVYIFIIPFTLYVLKKIFERRPLTDEL